MHRDWEEERSAVLSGAQAAHRRLSRAGPDFVGGYGVVALEDFQLSFTKSAQPPRGFGITRIAQRLRSLLLSSRLLRDQASSKRSRFMTLVQAATKSRTNAFFPSVLA